jgi:hypothetical protein
VTAGIRSETGLIDRLKTALDHYIVSTENGTDNGMKAGHEEMMAKMKDQIGAHVSRMDAHHVKREVNHEEWMTAMKASQEWMAV